MLRFSEGPRARAISASSIPVAECQVPFVSLSFTRDTYRASKRLKDEERRNGRSWRKTRGSPERKRRRQRKKRERDEKKRKPKEGRRSQVLKDGPKAFCLNLTRRGNASLLLSALLSSFLPLLSLSNGDLSSARKALNPFTHCSATEVEWTAPIPQSFSNSDRGY